MSRKERRQGDGRPEPIKDFAQMGVILGEGPQIPQQHDALSLDQIMKMPFLERAEYAYDISRDDSKAGEHLKIQVVNEALKKTPQERMELGIRIVAFAPLDKNGDLVTSRYTNFDIYTVLPSKQPRKKILSASRAKLSSVGNQGVPYPEHLLEEIDAHLRNGTTLYPETTRDRYVRCMLQLKGIDSVLKSTGINYTREQTPPSPATFTQNLKRHRRSIPQEYELNQIKNDFLLDFLRTAEKLERDFPDFAPLWGLTEKRTNSIYHKTLEIRNPKEPTFYKRLLHPNTPVILAESGSIFRTNINVGNLKEQYEVAEDGSDIRTLCETLGIVHP